MDNKELIVLLKEELSIPLPEGENIDKLRAALVLYINELIEKNFQRLVSLLYRLDISEKKLKQMLKDNSGEDAGLIIADLIIERQLQKLEARKQFKSKGDEIDEKEKW